MPVRASGDTMHVPVYSHINVTDFLKTYPSTEIDSIWLRYCATTQNVAGSIPDDVNEIFHWTNDQIVTDAATYTTHVKQED
jgi:hypothetical protein